VRNRGISVPLPSYGNMMQGMSGDAGARLYSGLSFGDLGVFSKSLFPLYVLIQGTIALFNLGLFCSVNLFHATSGTA